MEEVFQFCSYSGFRPPSNPQFLPSQIPKIPTTSHSFPPRPRLALPTRALRLSPQTPTPLPEKPPKPPTLPVLPSQPSPFHEKLLYLDSLGIDLFAAAAAHPPVASVPLAELRATVDLLRSIGLTASDLRRVCGMCPEVLAAGPKAVTPVLTFLLREAGVQGRDLRRVIHRRPRLLVSDVACRLRPPPSPPHRGPRRPRLPPPPATHPPAPWSTVNGAPASRAPAPLVPSHTPRPTRPRPPPRPPGSLPASEMTRPWAEVTSPLGS